MGEIQDGSAVFKIMDGRENEMNRKFVDLFYPVGIVVALANDKKPAFMNYGTWEKVAEDRMLQGSSDSHAPGSKIEAGLPNITGNNEACYANGDAKFYSGAFIANQKVSTSGKLGYIYGNRHTVSSSDYHSIFDASKSNPIYGKSTTVQPAAYVVAYWQRTA